VLCTGKVYFDLLEYAKKTRATSPTLRLFASEQLIHSTATVSPNSSINYGHSARLIWCQEEPQNMGAWSWIAPQLEEIFGHKAIYAVADAAASPAVGALAISQKERAALLQRRV